MENSMVEIREAVGEENSVGSERWKTKKKRYTRRNHFGSGLSLPLRGRSSSSIKPPFHAVFKFLIPSLLAVVAVKYQAISEDPSIELALHIWTFLITILLYSLVPLIMKQTRNHRNRYAKIPSRVALAAGVVSCLSLLSLILPYFHGRIVLYTSWALFVIISALPVFQCIYKGVLRGITTVLNILVHRARKLFTGSIFGQQPTSQGTRSPV